MNFLAHIYLSGVQDDVIIGNFMGDYVKGHDYNKYPPLLRKGMIIHRKIDSFTDTHPVVSKHKSYFQPKYRKYAGIVTDIIYDHFLSNDWYSFSDENFDDYVNNIYRLLEDNIYRMPDDLKRMVPRLVKNRWLNLYRDIEGIEGVLIGMSKGTSLPAEADFAMYILRKHYNEIKHDFSPYFNELIAHINEQEKLITDIHEI
jgi:acyl carrier protein phosphodiesterase